MNAMWQLPLLLLGCWALLRLSRAEPATQHGAWLGVLALAVVLPLRGVGTGAPAAGKVAHRQPAVWIRLEPQAGAHGPRTAPGLVLLEGDPAPRTSLWTARVRQLLRTREIPVSARATRWVVRLYVTTLLLAAGRVGRALVAASRLLRESVPAELCPEDRLVMERAGARLGVEIPEVRASERVRTPGVMGVRRPVMLLPEGFGQCTREEARAALVHEMAHLRRRDAAKQLAGEVVSLPVAWHPATWVIKAQLRQTREMACDAMAAAEMESATGYARCLLQLARRIGEDGGGRGLAMVQLGDGALEGRVLQLVSGRRAMGRRARAARLLCGAVLAGATVTTASTWHLQPAMGALAVSRSAVPAVPRMLFLAASAQASAPQAGAAPLPSAKPQKPVAPRRPAAPSGADPHRVTTTVHGWELTPEERARVEAQMRAAREQIKAATIQMEWVNSPEFRRQMEEARAEGEKARALVNSPEFRRKIEEARAEGEKARALVNSPEFRRQIEEARVEGEKARALVNSPEFRRQIEEARVEGEKARALVDSPEFRSHMEEARKQIDNVTEDLRNERMACTTGAGGEMVCTDQRPK